MVAKRSNRRPGGRHPHQAKRTEGDQKARIIVGEACGSPIAKSLKYNDAAAEVCASSITDYAAPALGGRQRVNKDLSK